MGAAPTAGAAGAVVAAEQIAHGAALAGNPREQASVPHDSFEEADRKPSLGQPGHANKRKGAK